MATPARVLHALGATRGVGARETRPSVEARSTREGERKRARRGRPLVSSDVVQDRQEPWQAACVVVTTTTVAGGRGSLCAAGESEGRERRGVCLSRDVVPNASLGSTPGATTPIGDAPVVHEVADHHGAHGALLRQGVRDQLHPELLCSARARAPLSFGCVCVFCLPARGCGVRCVCVCVGRSKGELLRDRLRDVDRAWQGRAARS